MVSKWLLALVLIDGLLWLRSSVGKVSSHEFIDNIGATLSRFASNNPYPWFKQLLLQTAIPNATTIGLLVMYAELLAALTIVGGVGYMLLTKGNELARKAVIAGLAVASLLNLTFWFAAGYTSPSNDSLNLLMLAVQVIAIIVLLKK